MDTRHGHSANMETVADRRGLPFVQPGNRARSWLQSRLVAPSPAYGGAILLLTSQHHPLHNVIPKCTMEGMSSLPAWAN